MPVINVLDSTMFYHEGRRRNAARLSPRQPLDITFLAADTGPHRGSGPSPRA